MNAIKKEPERLEHDSSSNENNSTKLYQENQKLKRAVKAYRRAYQEREDLIDAYLIAGFFKSILIGILVGIIWCINTDSGIDVSVFVGGLTVAVMFCIDSYIGRR